MTDEQIRKAARMFCLEIGQDPDAMISHGAEPDERGVVSAVMYSSFAWKLAMKEVRRFVALEKSVRESKKIDYE